MSNMPWCPTHQSQSCICIMQGHMLVTRSYLGSQIANGVTHTTAKELAGLMAAGIIHMSPQGPNKKLLLLRRGK